MSILKFQPERSAAFLHGHKSRGILQRISMKKFEYNFVGWCSPTDSGPSIWVCRFNPDLITRLQLIKSQIMPIGITVFDLDIDTLPEHQFLAYHNINDISGLTRYEGELLEPDSGAEPCIPVVTEHLSVRAGNQGNLWWCWNFYHEDQEIESAIFTASSITSAIQNQKDNKCRL
jgi:hypothetical protein